MSSHVQLSIAVLPASMSVMIPSWFLCRVASAITAVHGYCPEDRGPDQWKRWGEASALVATLVPTRTQEGSYEHDRESRRR